MNDRLQEIRDRRAAIRPNLDWFEDNVPAADIIFADHARADIDFLLSEVARLTAEVSEASAVMRSLRAENAAHTANVIRLQGVVELEERLLKEYEATDAD